MAFRLTNSGFGASDEVRGFTLRMELLTADITGWVPYIYSESGLEFTFDTQADNVVPGDPLAVTYMLEDSVERGVIKALGVEAFNKLDLDRIKRNIREGVLFIETGGGSEPRLLSARVEFMTDR